MTDLDPHNVKRLGHGGVHFQLPARALDRWNPGLRLAAADNTAERSISVYEVIGTDFWTGEGVGAKRVAGALRTMGPGPVTVNINSPGGDMFEGLAIYNLLREHDGHVTVKVLGMAASAASIIAMAADTIQVARAGFFMVHCAWLVAVGNRNDLIDVAEWLEPFDRSMAEIYAARTGADVAEMAALMEAEAWLGGEAAIERGFADEMLPSDQVERGATASAGSAVRRLEAALRASGMPKSEAMRLISDWRSTIQPQQEQSRAMDPADAEQLAAAAALAEALTRH